jgi:membrane associated rhomboid family serine protease
MKKIVFFSLLKLPLLFVIFITVIECLEHFLHLDFASFGVLPRTFSGLKGIFFSPLIHSDFTHLSNNAISLLILLISLRYFYKSISLEVFFWSWLISGLWLWSFGRMNFHIGASGLVYAISSFLFFSGLIRKHTKLMAISLFVVFLYGSLVWGLFPFKERVSWEGHLSGFLAGLILAWWFKNEGPPKQVYQYEIDEELEQEYTYHYKQNED